MTALERNGFPYKVVIAAMGVLGGAMGVIINTNGILFAAVIRDMGFRAGDLSVYYTILYLVSALSVTFTSRWFFTARHRAVMAALGTLYTAPFAAMCLYSRLWHWYAAAAVSGFGYSCMLVSVTTTLNNWFAARRGMVAGVALSASGVTGALLAPVFARCIQAFGWRPTALLIGALAFMLIVPAGAFWLIPDPSECGCRPWGEAPAAESEAPRTSLSVPGYVFVLCMIALAGTNALFQFNLQLPLFARSLGWSLAAGAALTSCSMIGNIAGKVVLGMAIDALGVYRAAVLLAGAMASAFVLFQTFPGFFPALCLGGVLFGGCYSVGSMLLPQLALAIWGRQAYRPYVSRLSAVNSFVAAFPGSAFPYLFDFTGGWTAVLVLCFADCVAAGLIFVWLGRWAGKR